jgi:hypothetical protein
MVCDLPVRRYDKPFLFFPDNYSPDHGVCLFSQTGVYDPYAADYRLFFVTAPCFPAVKDEGDIMPFQLPVGD